MPAIRRGHDHAAAENRKPVSDARRGPRKIHKYPAARFQVQHEIQQLQTELKDFNERILELESESRRGYAMEVLKAKAIDFARQIDELRCLLVRSKKGHKRSSVTVNFALWIKQLLDMAVQRLHDRNARQHCRTKNMHSAWGLNHRITGPSTCLPC